MGPCMLSLIIQGSQHLESWLSLMYMNNSGRMVNTDLIFNFCSIWLGRHLRSSCLAASRSRYPLVKVAYCVLTLTKGTNLHQLNSLSFHIPELSKKQKSFSDKVTTKEYFLHFGGIILIGLALFGNNLHPVAAESVTLSTAMTFSALIPTSPSNINCK